MAWEGGFRAQKEAPKAVKLVLIIIIILMILIPILIIIVLEMKEFKGLRVKGHKMPRPRTLRRWVPTGTRRLPGGPPKGSRTLWRLNVDSEKPSTSSSSSSPTSWHPCLSASYKR